MNRQCACCGGEAPSLKQWFNQDTGYAVCPRCFCLVANKESWAQAVDYYGHPGVHHSLNVRLVFVQGQFTCIDLVRLDTGRSQINNETLDEVRARYPSAQFAELDAWSEAKENSLCTEPTEITEDRFMEMLEVLPPQRWQRGKGCESFELCEHTSGRITAIFARFGEKYFEWQDRAGQSLAAHATHCGQVAA